MYVQLLYYYYTMSRINKTVALNDNDESFQIWKELFEKEEQNFSEWIRIKLMEEKERRLDKDYIYNQLAKAESNTSYWKKQLDKANEIQTAKEQANCKEVPMTREQQEREFDLLIKKIGAALEFRFICEYPEEQVLEDLAIEYSEIEDKPLLDDFLESKGYTKKLIIRREVTI